MEGRNFDIAGMLSKISENNGKTKFLIEDFVLVNQFDDCYVEVLEGPNCGSVYPVILTDEMEYGTYAMPHILEALEQAYGSEAMLLTDTLAELCANFTGHELHVTDKGDSYEVELILNPELLRQQVGEEYATESKQTSKSEIAKSNEKENADSIKMLDEYINSIDRVWLQNKIKKSIIAQDEVVDRITTRILYNQKMLANTKNLELAKYEKKHILLAGQRGTGKSEIIRQIANNLKIPVVVEHATALTEEGYIGRSVSQIYETLINKADGDVALAERGIIVIDEIDKKRGSGYNDKGVSTTSVQHALLPLLDSKDVVPVTIKNSTGSYEIDFDTSKLTVVLMGAFTSIKDKTSKNIGFNKELSEVKKAEYTTEDFIKAGMEIEFMGRIGTRLRTNDLSEEDLINVLLQSDISPLNSKKRLYEEVGIKISCDKESLEEMAKRAHKEGTNVRGLYYAFEEFEEDFETAYIDGDVEEIKVQKGKVRKIGRRKK